MALDLVSLANGPQHCFAFELLGSTELMHQASLSNTCIAGDKEQARKIILP